VVLLSLLAAAGLGALHALSPGHGKAVMAAYLVGSRGTTRQAIGLGATVTASHTLGVLALGLVSLSASSVIAPERLYPILGVVSGGIVIAIAGWLLLGFARRWWSARASERAHAAAHAHGHDHPHDHGHDHTEPAAAGWHSHGGFRHSHLPASPDGLRWRGMFALGLAGGMVPSVSAIILLLGSIASGRPAYGIALTIAFGAGMALVLVGIGVGVVHARGLLERMPSRITGRSVGRLVPAGSAGVMLVAGVLITAQAALTLR
jgi:ABC-type nickel/cobalt efflux system permease component RcnA